MDVTLESILAPGGAIARRMGELYEFRPQQMQMASAVQSAIERGKHLLVEAGTGVGKSFAYLLPAIEYAVSKKKRVVVSTHTISLQEQLVEKDIPLIQAVYPNEFTAVLVKGRGNYLCQRRLEQARGRQGMLFDQPEQLQSLRMIEQWARRTTDGSLSDLPEAPQAGVWERVCAEQGNCLGKKCKFYEPCFWQAAKRRMQSGDLLIVNHALFFSDLALRMAGVNYLPKYDLVILDEAHTVEDVAAEHFGLGVSENALRHQLRILYDERRGKGLLTTHGAAANDAIDDIVELHPMMEDFFQGWIEWQETSGRANGRVHEPSAVKNDLSGKLRDLALHMKTILASVDSEEDVSELNAMADKTALLAEELDAIVKQKMPDAVYWVEMGGRTRRNVRLRAAPVNVAAGLKEHLFKKIHSVTMCSATLCTGNPAEKPETGADPAFAYIVSRLGADDAQTLALGSPFDYARQATLFIESDLPQPGDTKLFLPAACEKILHYLKKTSGGAFVLFTSYSALLEAAERLRAELVELGLPLLVQGRGTGRKMLLDQFRGTPSAVLFGTASFWQGIDVRGEALRNVIIVKLPFSVPDEPLTQARLEAITRAGGNAFMTYSVPEAIMRLKQGFGRLIRCKTDTGIVVILDSRITTKRYGRMFLEALPACNVVVKTNADEEVGSG
ncbi:MAG: helicase C-terminal domain-containing protein [Tepidisphaeraceae bacterium]|jgi:ATP-dependent DNA helicase DinG